MKKRVLKITGKIILIIIAAIVVFIFALSIIHCIMTKKEKEKLSDAGYISTVSVNDKNINYYTYGNKNSEHTIVTISGLGVQEYGVLLYDATKDLSEENYIVNIDREGYGFSDDSNEEQTVEHIVNTYRTALNNLGIEGPYVLLPHSIGGVYATYWECTYPDEIEGIVYLDCTEISERTKIDDESSLLCSIGPLLSKTGLQRLLYKMIYDAPPVNLDENKKSYVKYMNIHNVGSSAYFSEVKSANKNFKTAYGAMKKNNIPKVYVNASSFKTIEDLNEYLDFVNSSNAADGQKKVSFSEEEKQNIINGSEEWKEKETIPYIEALGNCEYISLPGCHAIYEQKPDEVSEILNSFIDKLN